MGYISCSTRIRTLAIRRIPDALDPVRVQFLRRGGLPEFGFGRHVDRVPDGRGLRRIGDGRVLHYCVTSEGDAKFVSMSVSTPGAANAPPRLGTVIMTEIMYNPPSGNQEEEYIELYNTTSVSINLGGRNTVPWRFTNGIEYSFPSGTIIPANGYLIVARNPEAFARRTRLAWVWCSAPTAGGWTTRARAWS